MTSNSPHLLCTRYVGPVNFATLFLYSLPSCDKNDILLNNLYYSGNLIVRAIGLDVIATERIAASLAKYGERFVNRILGEQERQLLSRRRDRAQFVAGRFAAKEAAIKAMADLLEHRPPYTSIQVINEPGGKPAYRFAAEVADKLSGLDCQVSISHDRTVAAAVAVFSERS